MHKLVYTVFKTLMFSMIFVFVFDMAMYLYKALSLNQRMESIMTSMQKVVMENNYLPKDSYEMYRSLLIQLCNDMNGQHSDHLVMRGSNRDWFVDAIDLNYNHGAVNTFDSLEATKFNPATGSTWTSNILRLKMSSPADYGDVMVVQARVVIEQPSWGFTSSVSTGSDYWQNSNTSSAVGKKSTMLTYTYYVPCLNYQSVTQ